MLLFTAESANAVNLQNCSKGTTEKRLTCLQENVVLLNSSYQKVAAELRSAVSELRKGISEIPKPPDVSVFIRKDQPIKLGIDANRCLSATSGVSGAIPANPVPIDVRLLVTFQDCAGAPSWSFR